MKKKIIILTSFGGGGHSAASEAMKDYLHADYDVQLCHAFTEILFSIDPFKFLTFENYSSEQMYNALLPGKHVLLLKWIYGIGTWYLQSQKEKIMALLRNYFTTTKPDLIISVIPIINNMVLNVAQELNIPFVLMPTDLDVTPYIIGIADLAYEQFYLCLPFNDPDIMQPIRNAHIPDSHIHILGSPLRRDFFLLKNKHDLQQKYRINGNKPTVMLLMGSLGSDDIKQYTAQLTTLQQSFNLIVCVGKNEKSKKDLAQLFVPNHIDLFIIGFTKNIADYMQLSDLLITKSGTLSICEALYMNLPLFLDATSTPISWEEFNHHFIKKHLFGTSITEHNMVAPLIARVLENKDKLIAYKNKIEKLDKKDFAQELKKLVKDILKNR